MKIIFKCNHCDFTSENMTEVAKHEENCSHKYTNTNPRVVTPNVPILTTPNTLYHAYNDIPNACKGCPNHPSNGGSGICHCTLGNPQVTC